MQQRVKIVVELSPSDCWGSYKKPTKNSFISIYTKSENYLSLATVYYGVALLLINSVVRFLLPYSDHMLWISLLLLCLNIKTWIVLHIMQNLLLINFQQSSVIQNTDMWLWVAKVLETNETLLCQHITTQQLVIFLYHIFTWILTFTTKKWPLYY